MATQLLKNELLTLQRMLNLGVIDLPCYRRNVSRILIELELMEGV